MDGLAALALGDRRAAEMGWPLADFEDANGQLPHEHKEAMMAKYVETVQCRVETCDRTAPRFGPYAGRCDLHHDTDLETQEADEQLDQVLMSEVDRATLPYIAEPANGRDGIQLAQQVMESQRDLRRAELALAQAIEEMRRHLDTVECEHLGVRHAE